MIVAIDGPAGSGKTTTASKVAKKINFIHLNTGLMYRGITLKFLNNSFDFKNYSIESINNILNDTIFTFSDEDSKLLMDGKDITAQLNITEVLANVSFISSIFEVRKKMVQYQREISKKKNVVLEGRDIGSIVFPNAEFISGLNICLLTLLQENVLNLLLENLIYLITLYQFSLF